MADPEFTLATGMRPNSIYIVVGRKACTTHLEEAHTAIGRPTPIRPPRVKSADLLRPVVVRSRSVGSPSATVNRSPIAFSFSAVFVSSAGPAVRRRTQHLSRLSLRVAKGRSRGDSCGLETHSGPHAGLLMTSDVACARPLSPGSGEGQPIPGTRVHGGEESGRPIKRTRCWTTGS